MASAAQEAADPDGPLLASQSETSVRLAGFRQRSVDPETVSAQPQSERRLDSILTRRRQEHISESLSSDPFLASTTKSAGVTARQEPPSSRMNSVQAGSHDPVVDRPGVNRFTSEFDTQMTRIRDELDSRGERAFTSTRTKQDAAAGTFWADLPGTSTVSANPPAASSTHTSAADDNHAHSPLVHKTGAGSDTERLFETAREQAQEESLTRSQPQETEPIDAHAPSASDIVTSVAFEDLTPTRGSADSKGMITGEPLPAVGREEVIPVESISSNGGVTLLSPIADTFPSDTEDALHLPRAGVTPTSDPVMLAIARLARPNRSRTIHDSTAEVPTSGDGLEIPDSARETESPSRTNNPGQDAELLTSVVASRDRSMWFEATERAVPAAVNSFAVERQAAEPISVTPAPPLLMQTDLLVDQGSPSVPADRSLLRSGSGLISRSRWSSPGAWCMGGLVLLLVALRLMTRKTSAI
ncbi:MAG: hypothetical protein AB7I48_19880 [Planctomycetaceae bacterium]